MALATGALFSTNSLHLLSHAILSSQEDRPGHSASACSSSGLDLTHIERVTRFESFLQGNRVCIQGAQDTDMKYLVRGTPDIESAGCKALWNSALGL